MNKYTNLKRSVFGDVRGPKRTLGENGCLWNPVLKRRQTISSISCTSFPPPIPVFQFQIAVYYFLYSYPLLLSNPMVTAKAGRRRDLYYARDKLVTFYIAPFLKLITNKVIRLNHCCNLFSTKVYPQITFLPLVQYSY